jgi:hypothetical protein
MNNLQNPFSFLSALDGASALHRRIIKATRGSELEVATHMIAASKVSLIYAYSGNGKSSFVNAGLIPFFVSQGYAVFRTRPRPPIYTRDPSEAFKLSLLAECFLPEMSAEQFQYIQDLKTSVQALEDRKRATEIMALLARLEPYVQATTATKDRASDFREVMSRRLEAPMWDFVKEMQRILGTSTKMLFICDQFEELFVHFSNSPEMDGFISSIGKICRDETLKAQFVFSMREDWVGSMIEFRREVPDIFGSYFKLAPLRKTQAAPALTIPLDERRIHLDKNLLDRILTELCDLYDTQQLQEFSPVKLVPADKHDPYLELPALQVVADELWRTHGDVKKPFTNEHYEWLATRFGPVRQGKSPAAVMISDYLQDFLDLPYKGELGKRAVAEARLDILYLLTDRRAHRRALTEDDICEGMLKIRPEVLELPILNNTDLERLLEPLLEGQLVRKDTTPGGGVQYELAHDFAVREVVRRWAELEGRRDAEIVYREKIEKEINRRRLRSLFRQETLLRVGLLTSITTLLLLCLARFIPSAWDWVTTQYGSRVFVFELAAALVLASLGIVARIKACTLAGIASLVTLPWWTAVGYQSLFDELQTSAEVVNRGFTPHVFTAVIPATLCFGSFVQVLGLMLSARREKLKKLLYAVSVDTYDHMVFQLLIGTALWLILSTPLINIRIISPGPLWWIALALACMAAYGILAALMLRLWKYTPGSWLAGFRWNAPATTARVALMTVIQFALSVLNQFTAIGGSVISGVAGAIAQSGSVAAILLKQPPEPTPESTAREKPLEPAEESTDKLLGSEVRAV